MKIKLLGVGLFWHELGSLPEGMLCVTNDNGRNWESKFYPHTVFCSINDVTFVNDTTALMVGDTKEGCILRLYSSSRAREWLTTNR